MQEFLISVFGALLILGGFTGLIIWATWPQDDYGDLAPYEI